jgi:hypothetical protein
MGNATSAKRSGAGTPKPLSILGPGHPLAMNRSPQQSRQASFTSLRAKRSNPSRRKKGEWIASRLRSPSYGGQVVAYASRNDGRHDLAFSRRDASELCVILAPKNRRAQRRPGARCTRGLACKMHKANAHEHTGSAESIRPSLRDGFTAYNGLSPVTGLCCHRRPREASPLKNLTPASGCQDHTTSPYATVAPVSRAAASTASRTQRS